MRIALFSEVYWPMVSGVSLVLQRLVRAMEDRGHRVCVFAPHYELPLGVSDRPEASRVPARRLFLYPDVQWGFPHGPTIDRDFVAFAPDVVHVATEFAMGTTGVRLARRHGVPMVASAHTDYERYASRYRLEWLMPAGWNYLRWFYGHAARVLCPSVEYQSHLIRRGIERTGIWSRGVDLERFGPHHRSDAVRSAFGIGERDTMVLYVGRLAAEKNLPLLLDAWRRVEERLAGAKLVIIGDGPLRAALRSGLPDRVTLAGVRTGSELAAVYASADCFVFPSSTETFGNVLLEAMASGLPSLAARTGGALDFAVHGENALLVAPDDAVMLAEGLLALVTDRSLQTQLRQGALATARMRNWDSVFDLLEQEYIRTATSRELRFAA